MLQRARGADLLITIGGASVGDFDLVRRALGATGFDVWAAAQPGKPTIRATKSPAGARAAGEPGFSGITSPLREPAIERMLGMVHKARMALTARLARDLPANGERRLFSTTLLATPDGELLARPFDSQDSSLQRLLAAADCLVVRL